MFQMSLCVLLSSFNQEFMITFSTHREEFLAKIERRVLSYEIKVFNEPRPGKKLLVLDVDYTLFGKKNIHF